MQSLEALEKRTGSDWANLRKARANADQEQAKLRGLLERFSTADASIVVFGSLARQEFTPESDVDWALLLDGVSHPQDEIS